MAQNDSVGAQPGRGFEIGFNDMRIRPLISRIEAGNRKPLPTQMLKEIAFPAPHLD